MAATHLWFVFKPDWEIVHQMGRHDAKRAIEDAEKFTGKDWKELSAAGYVCIECRLTPVNKYFGDPKAA